MRNALYRICSRKKVGGSATWDVPPTSKGSIKRASVRCPPPRTRTSGNRPGKYNFSAPTKVVRVRTNAPCGTSRNLYRPVNAAMRIENGRPRARGPEPLWRQT